MNTARRPAPSPTPPARRDAAEQGLALKLLVVLSRAYQAVHRQVERDIARHGLTTAEFGALEALHHKGPLLLGELQRKILVSSGGVTFLVDRLAAKGLAERKACPEDRRARYAVLTSKGQALMREIFPAHAHAVTAAMSGLTTAEQEQAIRLLRALGRAADEQASDAAE